MLFHGRQHKGSRANLFPERGPDLRFNPGLGNRSRPRRRSRRSPHEHRWDLAESEELVTFWILRVFDGKRVGFF
jgi:hypothetical protein